jgi:hypothetical protein
MIEWMKKEIEEWLTSSVKTKPHVRIVKLLKEELHANPN